MPRERKKTDPSIAAFNVIHALPEAKALRAAALHYAHNREKRGVDHPLTRDAEENLYRQMFACHPSAHAALMALMEKKKG